MKHSPITQRILLVDDCAVDRFLARRILEQRPQWSVEEAENGQVAWQLIEESPPDLVITDLQMPQMDGLTLVNQIKHRFPNLPVILITSHGSESAATESLRGGATSYTPKDCLAKDLLRTCEYVLDLARHVSHPVTNRSTFEQRFVLGNDCSLIMPLIEHLQNFMPIWAEECRLQMGMAIGEALVNAIHHGNLEVCSSTREGEHDGRYYELVKARQIESPFCDRRVNVQAQFNQDELKISVSDEGHGFDPLTVVDPRDAAHVTRLHGRGLLLIRSFMDEVQHNPAGNQITMIKRRGN